MGMQETDSDQWGDDSEWEEHLPAFLKNRIERRRKGEPQIDLECPEVLVREYWADRKTIRTCVPCKRGRFFLAEPYENEFAIYDMESLVYPEFNLRALPDIEVLTVLPNPNVSAAGFFSDNREKFGVFTLNSKETRIFSVYDLVTKEVFAELSGHEKAPACVVFSRDSRLMASGGYDRKILLWETENFTKLAEMQLPRGNFRLLSLNEDGSVLIYKSFAGYKIYDVHSGSLIREFRRSELIPEEFISFIGDGKRLLSRSGESLGVYDTTSGVLLETLHDFSPVWTVCPENTIAASYCEEIGGIKIWDINYFRVSGIIEVDSSEITALGFFNLGRYLISGARDGLIKIWDTDSLRLVGIHELGETVKRIYPLKPEHGGLAVETEKRLVILDLAYRPS